MIGLENFWWRLLGKEFRAFVHAPDRMRAVLEAAGLVRANRCEALVWTLDLSLPKILCSPWGMSFPQPDRKAQAVCGPA